MAAYVAILEDNAWRVAEMRRCLARTLPEYEALFFDNAPDMIACLAGRLGEIAFVSLDHDLPDDAGTGREVADYLAALPPTCPVIVHSSNDPFAVGMMWVLNKAGWPLKRVYPWDDLDWVKAGWEQEIRKFIADGWIFSKREPSARL